MQLNDRYFGMTLKQLGLLAGLAVTACLLFSIAGWFALRSGLRQPAAAPQEAPALLATATPWTIPSPAPTGTATPIPYDTLIPSGWVQFKTGLVELWLPAEFEPGDAQFFNNSSNTAVGELILQGTRSEPSLYQMLVIVSYEPLVGESLDLYLDGEVAKLPSDIRVAERRKVTLNGTDVVRFVFETRSNNLDINDLTYVFQDGSTVWYVEYIAQINEFFEMLSVFEKSALTFRMVR